MSRPSSLLPALAAVVAVAGGAAGLGPGVAPAVASTPTSLSAAPQPATVQPGSVLRPATGPLPRRAEEEPVEPLSVTIESMTPSVVPESGPVRVTGTVTNLDDTAWSAINLYPVVGDAPLTTAGDLRAAVASDPLSYVGERITDPGPYDTIDSLAPGESADYRITLPSNRIEVTEPGVYWFGVHANGENEDGREDTADGRARTFLPLVRLRERSLPVSIVVPLRRQLDYTPEGALDDVADWDEDLGEGGRLRSLLDFGAAAGSRPVSWLVDPALTDAVTRLAAGNPERSLAPTIDPQQPGGDGEGSDGDSPADGGSGAGGDTGDASGSPSASLGTAGAEPTSPGDPTTGAGDGSSGEGEGEDVDPLDPVTAAAAETGQTWLDDLGDALGANSQVLALPYGDVDVAGAQAHDPDLYDRARRRGGSTLAPFGVETTPAIGSPVGFLPGAAVAGAVDGETVLLTDRAVPRDRAAELRDDAGTLPAVASVDGRRVVLTSSGAVAGGPGPGEQRTATAMRQRILAEAAVRVLAKGRHHPLVTVLPFDWLPEDGEEFFSGLDQGWVDLATVEDATADETARDASVAGDDLTYPEHQREITLPASGFQAADDLITAGESLQDLLTLNDQVGTAVLDQALASVSYTARTAPLDALASAGAAEASIDALRGQVDVMAPRAVTLSSESGRFGATIVNGLDQPVTIRLRYESDRPMTIEGPPGSIEVPADSATTVLLNASTSELGVHDLRLVLTDEEGRVLGSSDDLAVRSAQVSQVIWLIMGTGLVLLFGTIGLRLVRRLRDARRGGPSDQPSDRPSDAGSADDLPGTTPATTPGSAGYPAPAPRGTPA
ncbi:DUF6049 family protein [Nocardioides kribbensis]|uniref:DUF6049 family protein n=1 Tax=Nocardioides kribbensis TaxID=305517 RepID=UPI0032DBA49D